MADGNDLAFITVSLTDQDGNLIPDGDDPLTFQVEGAGGFKAVCNGDATSLESFTEPAMRLFAGQLVVVLQAGREKGPLTLTVHDKKLNIDKQITLQVR
jgi:beta-galactosidase